MSNQHHERLIRLTDWPKFHPYPTIPQLRKLVFEAEFNGFKKCIRRIGTRILISEKDFFEWVEEVNKRGGRLNER